MATQTRERINELKISTRLNYGLGLIWTATAGFDAAASSIPGNPNTPIDKGLAVAGALVALFFFLRGHSADTEQHRLETLERTGQ